MTDRTAVQLALVGAVLLAGCTQASKVVPPRPRMVQLPPLDAPLPCATCTIQPPFDLDKPEVDHYVTAYQTRLRRFFDQALGRGSRYFMSMSDMFVREGLPAELAYLPLIESGYRLHAVSHAGAAGPWQFIRSTGRAYGLRIDSFVDERRDPIKSTQAAIRYLKDLHGMFGDWQLSLAAYNSGEHRVAKILRRQGVESYWDMRERGYLPRETSEFVPRFLAAVRIASEPEAYGFESPIHMPLHFEVVTVPRQVSLRTAAGLCGVTTAELTVLNPALRRGVTPSGYSLRVPIGKAEPLRAALASADTAGRSSRVAMRAGHGPQRSRPTLARTTRRPVQTASRD